MNRTKCHGETWDKIRDYVGDATVQPPCGQPTDPEWDGQEMFHCQNPDCPDPVCSVDETCYVNVWKRSRKLMN